MNDLTLLLAILIAISAIGYIGYNIGLLVGRGTAETKVIKYCRYHPWRSAHDLIEELYPERKNLNLNPQNSQNNEEA